MNKKQITYTVSLIEEENKKLNELATKRHVKRSQIVNEALWYMFEQETIPVSMVSEIVDMTLKKLDLIE